MSEDEKKLTENLAHIAFLMAMAQALEKLYREGPHRQEAVFPETISQHEVEVAELERLFRL